LTGPAWCSRADSSPEEARGCLPTHPITLVGPLVVVEVQEAVQRALQPVLLEDRALQPLHEAVGPGVARLGPRVPNAEPALLYQRGMALGHPLDDAAPPAEREHASLRAAVPLLPPRGVRNNASVLAGCSTNPARLSDPAHRARFR
jgi:hypothetical protein